MRVKEAGFKNVFKVDGKFATINLVPGFRSSNEDLVKVGDKEYRIWDCFTSKPAAAFKKGLKAFPLEEGFVIIYLGLAEAKTASFFSDIIGKGGLIYGVELSERSLREAVPVCYKRGNIIPILGDARRPELYENSILDKVDCLYIDVASPDQVAITVRNAQKFLKQDGWIMISIKSQSIDVVKPPKQVYKECLQEFERRFEIIENVELDPYEKAHLFVIMKKHERNG